LDRNSEHVLITLHCQLLLQICTKTGQIIAVDKLSTLMSDNKILFGVADPSTCRRHVPSTCPETHTYTVLYPRRHESSINENFWHSSLLQTYVCMVRLRFTFTIYTIQWSTSVHDLHYDIFHAQFARHSRHYLYPCHASTVDTETNQDSIRDICDQSPYTVTTSAPILPVWP
jgi:hypothetical protein